jgi:hypothetical protein
MHEPTSNHDTLLDRVRISGKPALFLLFVLVLVLLRLLLKLLL